MILIILIICEILTRVFDNNLIYSKISHIGKPELFKDYKILSIGITRSLTYFLPNPKSDIDTHTDLILYCLNQKNNKFYYVLMYEDRIINEPSEQIENSNKVFTDIKIVKPNKYLKFKSNKFTYRITEMYDCKNKNWTISEIYELYKELLSLPYHRLKFNCHHLTNMILNIILDKRRKYILNMFEFDNTEDFKLLKYIYGYIKEKFGISSVDVLSYKKILNIIKHFDNIR